MDLPEYRECLEGVPFGKRVHTAVYIHRDEGTKVGDQLDLLLAGIMTRCEIGPEYNVIKFRTDELKVSFLAYPNFLTDAHPALRHAITIDLVSGKVRHTDYADNINPPILHRKEGFVPAEHPRRAEFEELTRAEEEAGLYEDATTIGFKLNWERLLQSKGLVVNGHSLLSAERGEKAEGHLTLDPSPPQAERGTRGPAGGVVIERHKTALTRYDLSKPVKTSEASAQNRMARTMFFPTPSRTMASSSFVNRAGFSRKFRTAFGSQVYRQGKVS